MVYFPAEMETEARTQPTAIFMAFGTSGDVYPIAAISAAFACDQRQYRVFFISHLAHQNLSQHLAKKSVSFVHVSSPPFLPDEGCDASVMKKGLFFRKHREECVLAVERIYGPGPNIEGDLCVINFFALEGWSLAELFNIRCVVAAPYIIPYSAPSSFEGRFKEELPFLYEYFQSAPSGRVCWSDVMHWMWPLFTEDWGSWRNTNLNLSPIPFTDPITLLPIWNFRPPSPLLLYGFSKEIVELPAYWPSGVRVCGFWFLPSEWQFSCNKCRLISDELSPKCVAEDFTCLNHVKLMSSLMTTSQIPPIFIGLGSVGRMLFLRNYSTFLQILRTVLDMTSYKFILFTAGFDELFNYIKMFASEESFCSEVKQDDVEEVSLFDGKLICFSGAMPYQWLFPRCSAAIHHGGSGTTAAALKAGIPQVICPFIHDQFYWAEKMFWLGVSPKPVKRKQLMPDADDDASIKEGADILSKSIKSALSPEIQRRALEVAETISTEDGVLEAVKILREEVCLGSP